MMISFYEISFSCQLNFCYSSQTTRPPIFPAYRASWSPVGLWKLLNAASRLRKRGGRGYIRNAIAGTSPGTTRSAYGAGRNAAARRRNPASIETEGR